MITISKRLRFSDLMKMGFKLREWRGVLGWLETCRQWAGLVLCCQPHGARLQMIDRNGKISRADDLSYRRIFLSIEGDKTFTIIDPVNRGLPVLMINLDPCDFVDGGLADFSDLVQAGGGTIIHSA